MAKGNVAGPGEEPELRLPRADVVAKLAKQVDAGDRLHGRQVDVTEERYKAFRDEYRTWDDFNVTLLRRAFTTADVAVRYEPGVSMGGWALQQTLYQQFSTLRDTISHQLRKLRSILQQVEEGLYGDGPATTAAMVSGPPAAARVQAGQRVFLVHGHDGERKLEVARYLERVTGREPIILHMEPNSGRTIIEKFEQHASEAGFAVILLTADDVGRARDGEDRPRSRQNVVFEFGFFVGALTRKRVAALYEEGVERPSDLDGFLYTSFGSNWQVDLAKELKAADIEVNLDKLIG